MANDRLITAARSFVWWLANYGSEKSPSESGKRTWEDLILKGEVPCDLDYGQGRQFELSKMVQCFNWGEKREPRFLCTFRVTMTVTEIPRAEDEAE